MLKSIFIHCSGDERERASQGPSKHHPPLFGLCDKNLENIPASHCAKDAMMPSHSVLIKLSEGQAVVTHLTEARKPRPGEVKQAARANSG